MPAEPLADVTGNALIAAYFAVLSIFFPHSLS
jgi:hypothetical protein